jgi:hypothetical protein
MYARQGGLPLFGAHTVPTSGLFTGFGMVLRAFPRDWRVTLRDVVHSEMQPGKAKVIGPIMPPVHAPPDQLSFCVYGFIGGRLDDAWAIPIHNQQLDSDTRELNAFFLRLLGIDFRIGKDSNDKVVWEMTGGGITIRANIDDGEILIQTPANKTIRIESPSGTIDLRGTTVKGTASGSGEASLTFKSETNANVTAYNPHTHTIPLVGTSGPPSAPMTPPVGTTNLKGT